LHRRKLLYFVDLLDRDSSNSATAASSRDRDFCWDDAEPSFHAARLSRTVSMAFGVRGCAAKLRHLRASLARQGFGGLLLEARFA
jgi:hypothetical protein